MTAEPVLSLGATLGEGPAWIGGALWFVDIKKERIYRFDPATRALREWTAPARVGWVLPTAKGGMIAGLKTGLHRFDPETGQFVLLHDPEPDLPENRLNDAATDAKGRLWFGSMDDREHNRSGRLYRCVDGVCADSGAAPVAITNGPAISADATVLYHTDTLGRIVWRAPIGDDGTLGPFAEHLRFTAEHGYPDGSAIDAEGCLWVAFYAGWGVRRFDPAGREMAYVRFPCANVTKIAFGGEGLRTAFATTARQGLDAAALAAQPLSGDVFSFEPGTTGLPVTPADI